jgi:sugar lactone lactonase YvrE
MPVPRPTSCAFGGTDLNELYVTSASTGLDGEALAQAPMSGAVFVLATDVHGQGEPEFAG